MLRSMYFSVRFDRKADPDIHYICPGGYEMELNGKSCMFDFERFYGRRNEQDQSVIAFEQYDLDTAAYPEAVNITPDDVKDLRSIKEFFIYTGEKGEPEINPVKLLSLAFGFDDGTVVDCTETEAVRNFTF